MIALLLTSVVACSGDPVSTVASSPSAIASPLATATPSATPSCGDDLHPCAGVAAEPTTAAPAAPPVGNTGSTQLEVVNAGVKALRANKYDDEDSWSAAAEIRNPTNRTAEGIKVDVNFKDASGRLVDSDHQYIDAIAPGKTAFVAFSGGVDAGTSSPTRVETVAFADEFTGDTVRDFSITDLVYRSDDYPLAVKGTLHNPGGAVDGSVLIRCAVYSGNAIVSGAFSDEHRVPAGATTRFETAGALPNLQVSSIRCSALAS